MVRSYRQLNAAKYEVIGALEERLPAYTYSRAEWRALGEGHDWHVYMPLTYVEQWVPLVFRRGIPRGLSRHRGMTPDEKPGPS